MINDGIFQLNRQPPAFELADVGDRLLHFPDQLSGPTIVLFWASWCPYCKALMHYQKAARKAPFWAARLRQAIDKTGL